MITAEDAKRIVRNIITADYGDLKDGERVVIDDEHTIERQYGWLFTVNTVDYVRTGDWEKSLFGAGPLLVLRDGSGVVQFSSAYDGDSALAAYEQDPERFPPQRP